MTLTSKLNWFHFEKSLFGSPIVIFLFLLSLFSGILLAGQILGMTNLYYPIPVILFSLFCVTVLFIFSLKTCKNFLFKINIDQDNSKALTLTSNLGYITGWVLLIILLVLPLILWPYSSIRQELAWDAGLYHLPKAAELVASHSLLDLSISYGDYPSGYEILVAFSLIVNRAGNLIGATHSLILVFFQLGLFLLVSRFSKLPKGVLFFASVFVFASFDIIRSIESNPFQMLRISAFDIGMNDFSLASMIVALLVFSPIGPNPEEAKRYSLEGMSASTLLIVGTKPNGILIALSMWALTVIYEAINYKKNRISFNEILKRWSLPLILTVFGGLWIIRNLIMIGSFFNPRSLEIQKFSITNNLFNPYFYNYMDLNFKVVLTLLFISTVLTIIWKKFHWSLTFSFWFLLLGFCITPTSAFFGSTEKPAEIAWRFGIYLLAFLLPVSIYIFDKPVNAILRKWKLGFSLLISTGMIIITGYGAVANFSRLKIIPQNHLVLEDQYQKSVGVDGYNSAYDFIRKNVRNSVIWVENGMPFYVFGEDLTNSISRTKNPDYLVFFQTARINSGGYPTSIATQDFQNNWLLVYEDSEGMVYKHKKD